MDYVFVPYPLLFDHVDHIALALATRARQKIEEEADQAEVRRWEGKGEAQDRLS